MSMLAFGLGFSDLYRREGLQRVDEAFLSVLRARDGGLADRLITGNLALHDTMQRVGITHEYVTYDGDHTNRIPERFEKLVLPFFARQLSFR